MPSITIPHHLITNRSINLQFELCVFTAQVEDSVTETIERRVIEWKFIQLDKNRDGHLNRREFRVLRRLVRKVVRPKRCTKNFPRHCDSDQDRKLSRQEWSVCLGLGINSKFQLTLHYLISHDIPSQHLIDSSMAQLKLINALINKKFNTNLSTTNIT